MKHVGMYLQDPLSPELFGNWELDESADFLEGTGTSRFHVRDDLVHRYLPPIGQDWAKSDISFEYFRKTNRLDTPLFGQVNALAVAGHTLELVERELGGRITWRSGGPLILRPHALAGINAYFDARDGSLNFGSSPLTAYPAGPSLRTCLSHDVVAHELGHAILDALRPLYASSTDLDTPAFVESFCDLVAMFSALEHVEVVDHLFAETKGELSRPNLVSQLGALVGCGTTPKPSPLIRSALVGQPYDPHFPSDAHHRSATWTAAIYEVLARLVKMHAPAIGFSRAVVDASKWVGGLVLRALHYTPPAHVTLPMYARLMCEADALVYGGDDVFREVARAVFRERNLWSSESSLSLAAPAIGDEIRNAAAARPTSLAKTVMRCADQLRIPRGVGIRLLEPTLTTTLRRVDTVKDERGTPVLKEIEEHYLSYAYEAVMPGWISGRWETGLVRGGGTLSFDRNWEALLLATYPC